VIRYAAEALEQADARHRHYERKGRFEAIFPLATAPSEAEALILRDPDGGLAAPRPYKALAQPGRRWILVRHYWIAFSPGPSATILAIFHDAADIPGRVRP